MKEKKQSTRKLPGKVIAAVTFNDLASNCMWMLINYYLRRWTKGYTIKQPNMDCQPTEITALMRHRAVFS